MDKLTTFMEERDFLLCENVRLKEEIRSRIDSEYRETINELISEIERLNTKKNEYVKEIYTKINDECDKLDSHVPTCDDKFFDILMVIKDSNHGFFFPKNSCDIDLFLEDDYNRFKRKSGLPEDVAQETYDWINKNIVIRYDKATCQLSGEIKGYRGMNTELISDGITEIEIEDRSIMPWPKENWDDVIDNIPIDELNIDYNFRDVMANAEAKIDVVCISKRV